MFIYVISFKYIYVLENEIVRTHSQRRKTLYRFVVRKKMMEIINSRWCSRKEYVNRYCLAMDRSNVRWFEVLFVNILCLTPVLISQDVNRLYIYIHICSIIFHKKKRKWVQWTLFCEELLIIFMYIELYIQVERVEFYFQRADIRTFFYI